MEKSIKVLKLKLKLLDSLLQEVGETLPFGFLFQIAKNSEPMDGDPPDPGGENNMISEKSALPVTSDWAEDKKSSCSSSVRMRSFEEIMADASSNRNILEIIIKKSFHESDSTVVKPPNLTFDQLGELLFDVLKIKSNDCLRVNLTTSRYDTREVMLKPGVDLSPYIKVIDDYYGHTVTTRKQSSNVVRVSFKNVPLNVSDEEIIHLCTFYGTPINNLVEYERLNFKKLAGMVGSTRYVNMKMTPGKSFLNYYWMEGSLPGDQGCRITVLHSGQERQCSHCLRTMSEGCPGQGQGRVCKALGTDLRRMIDYMLEIKQKTGYESLKSAYIRKFPSLPKCTSVDLRMEENKDENEDDADQQSSEFENLEKKLRDTKTEYDQKLSHAKRHTELTNNRINTATKGLDMFLIENLKSEDFNEFSSSFKFMVSQYSTLLSTPEGYTVDQDSNTVVLSDSLFSDILVSHPAMTDKVSEFKCHLKNKLSHDLLIRKERRNSSNHRPRLLSIPSKRSNSDPSESNPKRIPRPTSLPKSS